MTKIMYSEPEDYIPTTTRITSQNLENKGLPNTVTLTVAYEKDSDTKKGETHAGNFSSQGGGKGHKSCSTEELFTLPDYGNPMS